MQKTFRPFLLMRRHYLGLALAAGVILFMGSRLIAFAATTDTTDFSQTITAAGALSIEIVDASYATVASPSVTMGEVATSFTSQTSSATTFGTDTERIYWENGGANTTTYSITMAATDGNTTLFTDDAGLTGVEELDYNDANDSVAFSNDNDRTNDDDTTSEADAAPGQMGIDPSTGTIFARYGATTGMSLGGSEVKFIQASADSLTLMTKADNTNDYHAAYATGLTVKEYMAEGQQPAVYTINMTLTIA